MTEHVRSDQVTIHFEGKRCIHSRHCVLGRPDVFVPNVPGEWIHPERASAEEVAALAQRCPSGAITYERHDGGKAEAPPLVNTVRVRENGPLAFNAQLRFEDGSEALRATLCRCGQSKNKPFCDTSHVAAGFSATGEPATRESTVLAARDGVLNVRPEPNGPLRVEGNIEVVSGTGRTVDRMTKVAFCRCGNSANKPFCDGSHKRVGFIG